MQIIWSIKRKTTAGWQHTGIKELSGYTLRQVFCLLHGQDVVAEFIMDGQRRFFCGTDEWKQKMQSKGKAVTFAEAVTLLEAVKPDLLEQLCPDPTAPMVAEEFPGAVVEQVTITSPGLEEQQGEGPSPVLWR